MADDRPLAVLRAEIDTLDRAVLALLARRMEVVARIADVKRTYGVALRDPSRESALLADRARTAATLGLPAGLSDEVFRAVLRASRAHLAALGVAPGRDDRLRQTARVLAGVLARWSARLEGL